MEFRKDNMSEYCKNCYELTEKLEAKEQECEELKKWKEDVINLFDKTCRCKYLNKESAFCSFYNKECIAINQCLYKNQQVITEIKEMLKEICMEECSFDWNKTSKKHCGDCDCRYGQILQKISECEENNDMENN